MILESSFYGILPDDDALVLLCNKLMSAVEIPPNAVMINPINTDENERFHTNSSEDPGGGFPDTQPIVASAIPKPISINEHIDVTTFALSMIDTHLSLYIDQELYIFSFLFFLLIKC